MMYLKHLLNDDDIEFSQAPASLYWNDSGFYDE